MRNLKSLFLCAFVLFAASCSMSAKTDNKEIDSNGKETTGNASGEVVLLNKADFLVKVFNYEKNPTTWVYEGNKPCIIDFYADWCGPCKKVAPILKELAKTYEDDIVVYKIDVDKETELAAAFGIQSIPTILFVPQDGKPQMSMGALPKEEFVKQIDEFLLVK